MEKKEWSLPQLLQLSDAYWGTCTLHAGVKLDVFTHLSAAPLTASELAPQVNSDSRALAMLLNALSALQLLEKRGDQYVATEFSRKYLSKESPDYMGHIIMHHHHLVEGWSRLDEAVQTGQPVRGRSSHEDVEAWRESFLMGMFNLAMNIAPKIVPHIDLSGKKRLLDLGGGPGTYAIHFCRQNPELSAVICDLPTTRSFAEKTVASFGLSERISFMAGDFENEDLPTGFDVAWLSHILHSSGPETCVEILKKTAKSLQPGGLMLIQEFILADAKDAPVFPALFSLNMLIGTPGGQSYSESELLEMLRAAGAVDVKRLPLELPNGSGVVAGVMPG